VVKKVAKAMYALAFSNPADVSRVASASRRGFSRHRSFSRAVVESSSRVSFSGKGRKRAVASCHNTFFLEVQTPAGEYISSLVHRSGLRAGGEIWNLVSTGMPVRGKRRSCLR
jgi:hypothetical protein